MQSLLDLPSPPPAAERRLAVLVVDDQRVVREGLAGLLGSAQLPLRWVGSAATALEALALVLQMRPEVVVLDVDLAGDDGLALIAKLPRGTGVLVLTSHGDAGTRARALGLGALRFIEKHQPAADLLGAIVEIAEIALPRIRGEQAPALQGTTSLPPLVASSAAGGAGPL